jgi:hypothetical protein
MKRLSAHQVIVRAGVVNLLAVLVLLIMGVANTEQLLGANPSFLILIGLVSFNVVAIVWPIVGLKADSQG